MPILDFDSLVVFFFLLKIRFFFQRSLPSRRNIKIGPQTTATDLLATVVRTCLHFAGPFVPNPPGPNDPAVLLALLAHFRFSRSSGIRSFPSPRDDALSIYLIGFMRRSSIPPLPHRHYRIHSIRIVCAASSRSFDEDAGRKRAVRLLRSDRSISHHDSEGDENNNTNHVVFITVDRFYYCLYDDRSSSNRRPVCYFVSRRRLGRELENNIYGQIL